MSDIYTYLDYQIKKSPAQPRRKATVSGNVIFVHPDDYYDACMGEPGMMQAMDEAIFEHDNPTCHSKSPVIIKASETTKHMSEQQDILELVEELVTIDKLIRLADLQAERCQHFVNAEGFSAGKHIGATSIYENEMIRLAGIDLIEGGDFKIVMAPQEQDPLEADRLQLAPHQLRRAFPDSYAFITRELRQNTEFTSLEDLADTVVRRTRRKPALIDTCQRYLAEGRRAVLEELHEREEESAEQFYKANDDYGMF